MKYKGKEIGEKPTLEMVVEYITLKGYDLNPREIYIKYDNVGWKKKNKKPIQKLESAIDAINGVYLSFLKKKKPKQKKAKKNKSAEEKYFPKQKSSAYSEQLRDPRWQRRRLEIMQRDNFTCQICGSTSKTLNVHHHVYHYGYMPWEYADNELITLCSDCHKKLHEDKDKFKK